MNNQRGNWVVPGLTALVLTTSALAGEGIEHDPSAHVGAGLHKELIAGITPADFLKLGPGKNVAVLTLIASFTEANHGMNFNGYDHGEATFTVPVGWTVEVLFINPSPVPHSAIVVEKETLRKVQMGDPAFKGASIPNPVLGISVGKAKFQFVADEAGEYGLACGIPTHATAGHWVGFVVSATAQAPSVKLGNAPVREIK